MERDEKRDYLVSLRESTGMTRKDFAIEYNIPYPTITDWELGHRRVPEYLLRLLAYRIGLEKGISYVQEKSSSDKTNFKVSQIDKNNITSDIVDKLLFTNIEDDGEPVDCIIVLGSIKASKYRVPVAVHEYQKGRANKLLLCGGSVRDFAEGSMQEAEHMYHAAIAMGACEEDIILEKRSTNTVENVLGALMDSCGGGYYCGAHYPSQPGTWQSGQETPGRRNQSPVPSIGGAGGECQQDCRWGAEIYL